MFFQNRIRHLVVIAVWYWDGRVIRSVQGGVYRREKRKRERGRIRFSGEAKQKEREMGMRRFRTEVLLEDWNKKKEKQKWNTHTGGSRRAVWAVTYSMASLLIPHSTPGEMQRWAEIAGARFNSSFSISSSKISAVWRQTCVSSCSSEEETSWDEMHCYITHRLFPPFSKIIL